MSEMLYVDSIRDGMARINNLTSINKIKEIQQDLSDLKHQNADDRELYNELAAWLNLMPTSTEFYNCDEELDKDILNAFSLLIEKSRGEFSQSDLELLNLNKSQIKLIAEERLTEWRDSPNENLIEPHGAKRLNKHRKKLQGALTLHLGLVGGQYGSKRAINFMKWQRKNEQLSQAHWLKTTQVTNKKTGQKICLEDIAFTNEKRISEMMCRASGIEKYSERNSMRWARVVCTLPPRFHPNPTTKNTWDGSLPDRASRVLQKRWVNLRAYLAKSGVKLTGIWTREAHADSCPHVNYLIYFTCGHEEIVEFAFKKYFGKSKPACDFMLGGETKDGKRPARFSSYCMKYFTKHFIEERLEELNSNLTQEERAKLELEREAALGEETVASNFGYRRYGFIGTPPIGIWRKLRATDQLTYDIATKELLDAAKAGNYATYIELSGGLSIKNNERNFESITITDQFNSEFVAVKNKSNGHEFIVKELNIWELSKIVLDIVIEEKPSRTTNTVTVNQSYPSSVLDAHPETDFDSYYAPVRHRHRQTPHELLH